MKYVFKKKSFNFLFSIIDFIGNISISPFKISGKKFPKLITRILVIRLDHIGDVVSSTAIPQNLKNYYPNAKITFLVSNNTKEIVRNNPYIDEVVCYDAPWFSRSKKRTLGFRDFLNLVRKLRRHKYALGFDLRGDFRHILIMVLAGVKFRAGYGITGGDFLLDYDGKYNEDEHAVDKNFNLLKGTGIPVITKFPQIYFNGEDKNCIDRLLKDLNYNGKKAIVLHPYAGTEAKQWGHGKFKDLINRLIENNWSIFIIGAKSDSPHYDSTHDLRGKLNLSELAYLIKRVGFFIGLDSGPANIAAALNIPMIVITSGTNFIRNWIPKNEKAVFIYKDVECKPCELTICPKEKHFCMESITVDEVMAKINNQALKFKKQ